MSDDKLILYALPISPNSAVLRTFLLACEIPFEEKNVWGSTRSPEYIAKFPSNLAPAMEIGDFTISEGTTCIRYLAQAMPEKAGKYYSTDPKMAAKIDMVCDMINTGFCTFLSKAVYPDLGFPAYPGDVASLGDEHKELVAKSQKLAADHMETYLKDKFITIFLSKTKFLLTDDEPTLADFRLAPMLSQIKCAFPMPERIEQYLADLAAKVPGFAEGMKPVDEFHSKFWKSSDC